MPAKRARTNTTGQILSRRLDQLRSTLDALKTRLRATVAGVVGETIGDVVRDVLFHVLDKLPRQLPNPTHASRRRPLDEWDERQSYYDDRDADNSGYWEDDGMEEDATPITESEPRQTLPLKLSGALSAGCYAAAWWLQRWQGRWRLLSTLVVGLLTTGAAFLGGPLATGVNLAASVTQLGWLIDAVNSESSPLTFLRPG